MVSLKFQAAEQNGGRRRRAHYLQDHKAITLITPTDDLRVWRVLQHSVEKQPVRKDTNKQTMVIMVILLYGVVGHRRMHAAQCSAAEAAVGKKKGEEKGKDSLVEFAHLEQLLV